MESHRLERLTRISQDDDLWERQELEAKKDLSLLPLDELINEAAGWYVLYRQEVLRSKIYEEYLRIYMAASNDAVEKFISTTEWLSIINTINRIDSSIKDRVRVYEKTENKRAQKENGKKGAAVKNAATDDLKTWAIQEAKSMTGDDRKKSETLAQRVPDHLKDASANPQRLIYDAIRDERKRGWASGKPGLP